MTSYHKKITYDRGLKAERLATLWLRLKGFKILEIRYKTPVGEIDIIAQKSNLIAFIEVKARQTKTNALESITDKMKGRINRAANYYIAHHETNNYDMRFDVIIVFPSFLGMPIIQHLDNMWEYTA